MSRLFHLMRISATILSAALTSESALAAGQKYAIAQYDAGSGAKLVIVLGFKAAECQKLIDTFTAGLKLDCPACRKDYGSCTTDLGHYRTVWNNEKYIAPYVSHGTQRYIYIGMARRGAEAACSVSAEKLRSQGREASCVK